MMFGERALWRMFLSHLENSPSEDWNHAYTCIERDRFPEELHDRTLRARVAAGR